MVRRIDKTWVVLESLENRERDRCADFFRRPDGGFGFEEFRRDAEDGGVWTPVHFYSGAVYRSREEAMAAARRVIGWLAG